VPNLTRQTVKVTVLHFLFLFGNLTDFLRKSKIWI